VASEAVFGQATWNLADTLHLTGGARFTWTTARTKAASTGLDGDPTVPQVPIDPDTNPLAAGSGFSAGNTTTATTPARR
jgi:outer membrane receptor protein involved in Fe transport